MSKQNEEQLEAKEINTTPRFVVTAESFYSFPAAGREITLMKKEIEALITLMDALRREQAKGGAR